MLYSSKEYCQKKRFREKEYLEFRCIDISNLLRINQKKMLCNMVGFHSSWQNLEGGKG